MGSQQITIQLVVDSRLIWQVKQDVPREHCRRMTEEELKAIGSAAAAVLAGIMPTQKTAGNFIEPQSDQSRSSGKVGASKRR